MVKVQFGCGVNYFDGWINHDIEVNIRNPLPYEKESVDLIFIEHTLEHISPHEAYRFLKNAYDILKVGGKIRVSVPSPVSIMERVTPEYNDFVTQFTNKEPSVGNSVEAIIFLHGHESMWDEPLLEVCMKAVGFKTLVTKAWTDTEDFLVCNVHQYAHLERKDFYNIETISVEGTK